MVEEADKSIRTYEDLLWDKVVKMSQAKEQGNDYFFDELLDETEILIQLVPVIYARFAKEKKSQDYLLNENIQMLKATLALIQDDITKDLISTQKSAIIKWEYRSDMLEIVLKVLNEFQMIPFANPYISEVIATPEEPIAEPVAEPVIEEPPPNPQTPPMRQNPTQQKPFYTPPQQQSKPQPNYPPYNPDTGKKVKLRKPEFPQQ